MCYFWKNTKIKQSISDKTGSNTRFIIITLFLIVKSRVSHSNIVNTSLFFVVLETRSSLYS